MGTTGRYICDGWPLGLQMGIPFPRTMRGLQGKLQDRRVAIWGVNGLFTLVGAPVTVSVALTVGFTWVLMAAAIAYGGVAFLKGFGSVPASGLNRFARRMFVDDEQRRG